MADDRAVVKVDSDGGESDVEFVEEIIEIDDGDDDPRLDFFSDRFDPLLALRTPGVQVLDSTAKVYDNLSAYKVHGLDGDGRPTEGKAPDGKTKTTKSTEVAEGGRKWKEHQYPVSNTKVRKVKNLWTRMEETTGPLALLQKCIVEKLRLKVWTRNDRRVRGYCLANLVAFDKYWNMALEDVTEVWSRLKKRKVPAFDSVQGEHKNIRAKVKPPAITVTPHETDKKLETCQRHVPQLLIRGEHVVMVNVVREEGCSDETSVQK